MFDDGVVASAKSIGLVPCGNTLLSNKGIKAIQCVGENAYLVYYEGGGRVTVQCGDLESLIAVVGPASAKPAAK